MGPIDTVGEGLTSRVRTAKVWEQDMSLAPTAVIATWMRLTKMKLVRRLILCRHDDSLLWRRRTLQIASDTDSTSTQRALHPFAVIECLLFSSRLSVYPLSLCLTVSTCRCTCPVCLCLCVFLSHSLLDVDNDDDVTFMMRRLLIGRHWQVVHALQHLAPLTSSVYCAFCCRSVIVNLLHQIANVTSIFDLLIST